MYYITLYYICVLYLNEIEIIQSYMNMKLYNSETPKQFILYIRVIINILLLLLLKICWVKRGIYILYDT